LVKIPSIATPTAPTITATLPPTPAPASPPSTGTGGGGGGGTNNTGTVQYQRHSQVLIHQITGEVRQII
jgi:hypothetical protein